MQVLISLIGFLIAITVLVGVHEFGHFWVARRFGIKVLRFSIGIGRPFFRWYDKLGTEYVLSVLPLGGYVALYGEKTGVSVPKSERHLSFSHKPVYARMAVLVAGPLFNFLFALIAYWLVLIIGITSFKPIIGPVAGGTPAELAGLRQGQEIVSIADTKTPNWNTVSVALMQAMGEHKMVNVTVHDLKSETPHTHSLDLAAMGESDGEGDLLKELGLTPYDPYPPIVGKLLPDHPALLAGMLPNDRIIAVDNHPINSRTEATDYIQPKINVPITLTIERGQETKTIHLTPVAKRLEDGKVVGFIGVEYATNQEPAKEFMYVERLGVFKALSEASKRTLHYTKLTFSMLKKIVTGELSVKTLSGPVAIAQYAGHTVQTSFVDFLSFLALISISLGAFNLLPIPLLDGGNLLYCLCELITGRPLSERVQTIGFWIGGMIILMVLIFVFYNDLSRF